MSMCLKHLGFSLLLMKTNGRQLLPDTFAHPRIVTLSFAFLKFEALVTLDEFNEYEGIILHHNPVSSAL